MDVSNNYKIILSASRAFFCVTSQDFYLKPIHNKDVINHVLAGLVTVLLLLTSLESILQKTTWTTQNRQGTFPENQQHLKEAVCFGNIVLSPCARMTGKTAARGPFRGILLLGCTQVVIEKSVVDSANMLPFSFGNLFARLWLIAVYFRKSLVNKGTVPPTTHTHIHKWCSIG